MSKKYQYKYPLATPDLQGNELSYVTDCINSGWISSKGKYVSRFEEQFADFCNTRFAIAVTNGTAGLHLALLASGIGSGDEVIVPSLSFIATANAVSFVGAKPVFVDCDPETWTMDPEQFRLALTEKTKAVIPVHLYGYPADMKEISALAKKNELIVIEDAAEAHGAEFEKKTVGGLGDIGVFSFFANKIVTTGEGGMVVTNDEYLASRIRLLRDHGMAEDIRYWHPVLGYNYRLTNLQAAVGVAQMERISQIIDKKIAIAEQYRQFLSVSPKIQFQPENNLVKNVYWLFSILIGRDFSVSRDRLVSHLQNKGIETRPFFIPIHQQPIYNQNKCLPVCEDISARGLSLPLSTSLSVGDTGAITKAILELA